MTDIKLRDLNGQKVIDAKKFYYDMRIRERHLDSFGHVNNATYLEIYEEARWDFITENGYGLERIQIDQIGPVVMDLEVIFKRELRNRELITITSQIIETKRKGLIVLEQTIFKKDSEKIASTAKFTIGLFDLKIRKLILPPDDWAKAVGIVFAK